MKQQKNVLFHFEHSFHSSDNQILTFENNLESKHNLVMKFGQFIYITK